MPSTEYRDLAMLAVQTLFESNIPGFDVRSFEELGGYATLSNRIDGKRGTVKFQNEDPLRRKPEKALVIDFATHNSWEITFGNARSIEPKQLTGSEYKDETLLHQKRQRYFPKTN